MIVDGIGELRLALRTLVKEWRFSAVVILTLSLGIGTAAIMFNVVEGALLRPLPFAEPDRLAMVWQSDPSAPSVPEPSAMADYLDFRERSEAFQEIAAYGLGYANLLPQTGDPLRVRVAHVTTNLTSVLGVAPGLGREFDEAEATPGGSPVLLISDRFWNEALQSDPGVLGTDVVLDGVAHSIIGVLPETIEFPTSDVDAWIPLQEQYDPTTRRPHDKFIVGRLADSVSLELASDELSRVAAELVSEFGNENRGALVEPLENYLRGGITPTLRILMSGFLLLFLLACVNAANIVAARGVSEAQAAAVRLALGASRPRLLGRYLAQAVILGTATLALAAFIVVMGLPLFLQVVPTELLGVSNVRFTPSALLFSAVLAAAAAAIFPVLTFLQVRGVQPNRALRAGRGSRQDGLGLFGRRVLVAGQLGLALLLLVPAVLMLSSVRNLHEVDTGFAVEDRLRVSFLLPSSRYPRDFGVFPDWPEILTFNRELGRRVNELPGVIRAAITLDQPLAPGLTNGFRIVGREPGENQGEVPVRFVSPEYFETVGSSLVAGRGFDELDNAQGDLGILLNEEAAARLFPGESPIGQQFAFWGQTFPVRGIVSNERFYGLREAEPPAIYFNLYQIPSAPETLTLVVHAAGGPEELIAPIRGVFRSLDSSLAPFDIKTMDETLAESISRERLVSSVFGVSAGIALLLSLIGVYGLLSYAASLRLGEIAVRMAVGATPKQIRGLLVSSNFAMIVSGTLIGVVGALGISRVLDSLLFDVDPLNAFWYVGSAIVLIGTAILASLIPAIHASNRNPLELLSARDS